MDIALLKRFGFLAIAAALVLGLGGASLPGVVGKLAVERPQLAQQLGVLGVAALVVNAVLARVGTQRCRRCGKRAAPGAVWCAVHQRDLQHQAHIAMARQLRENRGG